MDEKTALRREAAEIAKAREAGAALLNCGPGGHLGVKYWLGRSRPVELMRKMSAASQAPEAKAKRYAGRIGKRHAPEHRAKIAASTPKKAVQCLNTGSTYSSAYDAAKATGLAPHRIHECASGKRKTAKGTAWRFI